MSDSDKAQIKQIVELVVGAAIGAFFITAWACLVKYLSS